MSSTGGPATATPAPEPAPDPASVPAPAPGPGPGPGPDAGPTAAPVEAPPTGAARIATDLRAALGPLTRRLRTVKPDGELTLSQTSALVLLDRDGPATASELAAREGIRPQSMCTIVGALAERGLVSRAQDPHDGRRIVVSLTDSGRDGLHGARRERARRLTLAIGEELSPHEQEQLAAAIPLLERITRRV